MAANNPNKETISTQTLTHSTGAVNTGDGKEGKGVFVTHVVGSKAAIAQKIFNEHGREKPRKDVIAMMIRETGLTQSGASTYYQNMKKNAGMVHKRELVTTKIEQGGHTPPSSGGIPSAVATTTAAK